MNHRLASGVCLSFMLAVASCDTEEVSEDSGSTGESVADEAAHETGIDDSIVEPARTLPTAPQDAEVESGDPSREIADAEVAPGAGPASVQADASVAVVDAMLAPSCVANARGGCVGEAAYRVCSHDGTSEMTLACPASAPRCETGQCVGCTEDRCEGPGKVLRCTADGFAAVECGSEKTCVLGSTGAQCGGDCRAGVVRCNPSTKSAERCRADGTWEVEACPVPNTICTMDGSKVGCEPNLAQDFGNKDASLSASWELFAPNPQRLYFVPFVPVKDSFVAALRLTGAADGGACRMSLYDDKQGRPSRKFFSIGLNFSVKSQPTGLVPPVSVTAQAGKTYWIAAACGESLSGFPQLLQKASPEQRYFEMPIGTFTDYMPLDLDAQQLTPVSGKALSFFVSLLTAP